MKLVSQAAAVCVILALATGAASADSASYTYDTLGRLATVQFTSGTTVTTTVTYTYDLYDNRTGVVTTCSGASC